MQSSTSPAAKNPRPYILRALPPPQEQARPRRTAAEWVPCFALLGPPSSKKRRSRSPPPTSSACAARRGLPCCFSAAGGCHRCSNCATLAGQQSNAVNNVRLRHSRPDGRAARRWTVTAAPCSMPGSRARRNPTRGRRRCTCCRGSWARCGRAQRFRFRFHVCTARAAPPPPTASALPSPLIPAAPRAPLSPPQPLTSRLACRAPQTEALAVARERDRLSADCDRLSAECHGACQKWPRFSRPSSGTASGR